MQNSKIVTSKTQRMGLCIVPHLRGAHFRLVNHEAHAKKPRPQESTSYNKSDDDDDGQFSFQFRETRISLSKQNMALSGLALLGLSAVLGPLIFGIFFTCLSIVLASLGGALAISTIFIPLVIFSIVFVLVPFSGFAVLGLKVIAPTFLQLFLTGSAMALGWWAMNKLLMPSKSSKSQPKANVNSNDEVLQIDPAEVAKTKSYEDEEKERVQAELNEFDQLLQLRERRSRLDQSQKDLNN